MPHPHDGGGLSSIARGSTGSTSSGGLAARFKENPLGVIGTALQSFIEGSQGKPISALAREADKSKREFERRRLAILESGETRAISAEGRAVSQEARKTAEEKRKVEADALKKTRDTVLFNSTVAKTYADAPNAPARDLITDQMDELAAKNEDPHLAALSKQLREIGKTPTALSELHKASAGIDFIGQEAVQEIATDCAKGAVSAQGKCVIDSIKRAEDRLFKSLDNSTLIAGLGLWLSGASLDGVPPKERAIIEAAAKRGPEAVRRLLATVQTRVVQDQPTRSRIGELKAQQGTLNVTQNLFRGILDKIKADPTSFAALGKVKGGFQNFLGILRDTGDALFPRIQGMVQSAKDLAEREGEPFIISLFSGFNPNVPNAKMVGQAGALLYARALRGDSKRVTQKEFQLQLRNFDFTRAEALDQLKGRLEAVVNTIIPELQDSLTLQRGVVENPGSAVRDIQDLQNLLKKHGIVAP